MKQLKTISEFVSWIRNHFDEPVALCDYGGLSYSTKAFLEEAENLARGLIVLGIKKGDTVGIISDSSVRWVIADFAILLSGGITVPFFPTISEEHFIIETDQSKPKILFAFGADASTLLEKTADRFKKVIHLGNEREYQEIVNLGKTGEVVLPEIKPDDIATILYTSGSTGDPKGVVLTHKSLLSMIHHDPFTWEPKTDRYLSILPLAHIYARTINFFTLHAGVPVTYTKPQDVAVVAKEIKPTFMILVPRIIEKVYAKMVAGVEQKGGLATLIGRFAFMIANKDSWWCKLLRPVGDALVYKKLRAVLGGNMKLMISGGAPLNPKLNKFFLNIGFPLYEGWGMTECSTPLLNLPAKFKIGTVGTSLGGIEIKISDIGELLVRGENVMKEYFKNPEATARTIDAEGWLHTGDKASMDQEGFVKIYGRIKEMFKTSTGEFVIPAPIEQEICQSPFIEMAMIIAQGRSFVTCLLFPDHERFKGTKEQLDKIEKHINKVNKHLDKWDKVVKYQIIEKAPSIESGELTPTLKIRREVIAQKYEDLIEAMYEEHDSGAVKD